MAKTVTFTFNCDTAGEVTWTAPRRIFNAGQSDRELQDDINYELGTMIGTFFRLLAMYNRGDKMFDADMHYLEKKMEHAGLKAVARAERR
jgi:hypothetical protein